MEIEPKIMSQVKSILGEFGNKYLTSKGSLKRNNVINDLDKFDRELMTKLFKDPLIHKNYVEKIADNEVFKLNQFIEMFEYKEFWEDSYTKYTNKIGLTANGKFVDESADVVLDFPFKDTVLKAGMTKEDLDNKDVPANEPFLNETIAQPEIDELLEPKIFVNTKKYDQSGEHKISSYSGQDNLIIKGNNLIALYSLKEFYTGTIKSVFLDPPYYFEINKPSDTFSYNSNFKLSSWLVFMKNRLEITRELLSEKGTIFITMSDEGVHYLKVLADSIFGFNNFIADVTWESRASVSSDGFISLNSNHILIYAKDLNQINKNDFRLSLDKESFKFNDNDGLGPYRIEPFDAPNVRKNLEYAIVNPNTNKTYFPPKGRCWRTTEKEFKKLLKSGRIKFGSKGKTRPQLKAYYEDIKDAGKGKASSTIWHDISVNNSISWLNTNTNTSATKHLRQIFGSDVFTNPKPEDLIKRVLELSTDKNDIVLDFFMGSATTQAVAMKMHRRFIGIEQMDYINTVSVPRLQKVMDGEQGGISKDVNWQGGGSFVYAELMEKNQGYLKDLLAAKDINELDAVYKRMKVGADFDFRVDLDKYENDAERKALPFEEQKRLLVKLLDKNQLYYNFNNIDDADVRDLISDKDYQFNQSFYGKRD
ncbi:DNA methyltransferase [Furfurilactobacillus milii]|uniref:Site-specific DNA-methyltransferase n=1 Tax=Furfurilactobacillus rossiae TaxID=231049 RepID=A0A7C9N6T1_9LACO|nr:site-specific DNA-methyltransferase [Furfurilactobacillus milii]MYV06469.1 site-specific DNA-methyltransferase [Furfurilactobacillus milii]